MSRAIWKGTVGFGMVNIPVALHTAAKDHANGVSMRQLHECVPADPKKKQDRVVSTIQQIVQCANQTCPEHGKAIPRDQLLKGYEHTKGQFVVMDAEDIAAAVVEGSKSLQLTDFVPSDQVDPRFFEQPYFLLPEKGGEKAYALLREAIRKRGVVGLGTFAPRQNSLHVSAVTVSGDAIMLTTMRWNDDVVPAENFQFPDASLTSEKEIKAAVSLVETLLGEFDPAQYENPYRENLMGIIEAKMKGEKVEVAVPAEAQATPVVDLMDVLTKSVAAAGASKQVAKAAKKQKKSA